MRITHLKSSTELIEAGGLRILTDPWLVDGEYYGSWYHVPPFTEPIEEIRADAIYISHIHPDHISKRTLERLPRTIPVYIHHYAQGFLRENIRRLGFEVVELERGESRDLGGGVSINIFPADNCDPGRCGRFIGCAPVEHRFGSTGIDSMAVITDGEYVLLNTNDCPYELALPTLDLVLSRYPSIDFLLVGYAGAGPYPQCFHFDDEGERRAAAKRKERQFLDQAVRYIAHCRPKWYMPFAGTYTLGGSLAALNRTRGVPDIEDALDYLETACREKGLPSRGVLLNSGGSFDLTSGQASVPYCAIPEAERRARQEEIARRPLDYELLPPPTREELLALLPAAHARFERKREDIRFTTPTRLLVQISDDEVVRIPFPGDFVVRPLEAEINEPGYVLVSCDLRLLKLMLQGPRHAHWNNAEIGSHLRFRRDPDRFERGIYHCLCFLHV